MRIIALVLLLALGGCVPMFSNDMGWNGTIGVQFVPLKLHFH